MQSISEIIKFKLVALFPAKMYVFSFVNCLKLNVFCDKLAVKSERGCTCIKVTQHPLYSLVVLHVLMLQLLQDQVLLHVLIREDDKPVSPALQKYIFLFNASPASLTLFKILGMISSWFSISLLTMAESCITWASQNCLSNVKRALVNSLDAGLEPVVKLGYLINQSLAWKIVIYCDSSMILTW